MACRAVHCRALCHLGFFGLVFGLMVVWTLNSVLTTVNKSPGPTVVVPCVIASTSASWSLLGPDVSFHLSFWANASTSKKAAMRGGGGTARADRASEGGPFWPSETPKPNASSAWQNLSAIVSADSNLRSVGDELLCVFQSKVPGGELRRYDPDKPAPPPDSNDSNDDEKKKKGDATDDFWAFEPIVTPPGPTFIECVMISVAAFLLMWPSLAAGICTFGSACAADRGNFRLRNLLRVCEIVATVVVCVISLIGGVSVLIFYFEQVGEIVSMRVHVSTLRRDYVPVSGGCIVAECSCGMMGNSYVLNYTVGRSNVSSDPFSARNSYISPCFAVGDNVACLMNPKKSTEAFFAIPEFFIDQLSRFLYVNSGIYGFIFCCAALAIFGCCCAACCSKLNKVLRNVRGVIGVVAREEYMQIQDDGDGEESDDA